MAAVFKPDSKLWKGEIHVKKLKYTEKVEMMIDAGINVDVSGKVHGQENLLKLLLMQYKFVKSLVEKVDLVAVDGTKVGTLDDLMEYEGGKIIISQLFDFASGEQSLGKPSKKS